MAPPFSLPFCLRSSACCGSGCSLRSSSAFFHLLWLRLIVSVLPPRFCAYCSFGCPFLYPLSTLPEHIHSTILSYAKITCKTHTHNPKKMVSIPLTLVPSLANYHSLYSPPSLGVPTSLTQACHSSFWRHTEWYSVCRPPYFCAFAFGHGVKVTGVYHASFLLETFSD